MIIKVDQKGSEILTQLLDMALRQGGIKNLEAVAEIAQQIELIEDVGTDSNVPNEE